MFPWTYFITDPNDEEIVGRFYEKIRDKQIKKNLWYKKQLREKVIRYMSNGKAMIIYLIAGLMKKALYKMSQYVPKLYDRFDRNAKYQIWKWWRC